MYFIGCVTIYFLGQWYSKTWTTYNKMWCGCNGFWCIQMLHSSSNAPILQYWKSETDHLILSCCYFVILWAYFLKCLTSVQCPEFRDAAKTYFANCSCYDNGIFKLHKRSCLSNYNHLRNPHWSVIDMFCHSLFSLLCTSPMCEYTHNYIYLACMMVLVNIDLVGDPNVLHVVHMNCDYLMACVGAECWRWR